MSNTTAVHGSDDSGNHVVGVENLRVVLVPDEDYWFAQGLEIDYAAQGDSVEDAREKFQNGLSATIYEHLKVYGTIAGMLRVAPQEAWDLVLNADAKPHRFTHVSLHRMPAIQDTPLPFQGIQFIELIEQEEIQQ